MEDTMTQIYPLHILYGHGHFQNSQKENSFSRNEISITKDQLAIPYLTSCESPTRCVLCFLRGKSIFRWHVSLVLHLLNSVKDRYSENGVKGLRVSHLLSQFFSRRRRTERSGDSRCLLALAKDFAHQSDKIAVKSILGCH